jgi:hypothetical protein
MGTRCLAAAVRNRRRCRDHEFLFFLLIVAAIVALIGFFGRTA